MDTALAVLALVLAAIAIAAALTARRQVQSLAEQVHGFETHLQQARSALALVEGDLRQARLELDQLRTEQERAVGEVAELRAAVSLPAPPPLPRARAGSLDDLRQQLRAAHRADDESSEE